MKKMILLMILILTQMSFGQWEACNKGVDIANLTTAVITDDFIIVNGNDIRDGNLFNYISYNDSFDWIEYNPLNKQGTFVKDNNSNKVYFFSDSIYCSGDNLKSWIVLCKNNMNDHYKICVEDSIFVSIDRSYICSISHDFGKTYIQNDFFPGIGGSEPQIFISGTSVFCAVYHGAGKTTDFGLTWNGGVVGDGKFQKDNNNLYYGCYGFKYFWKSTDNGITWESIDKNFKYNKESYDYYQDFIVVKDTIFIFCYNKLFVMTDDGKNLIDSINLDWNYDIFDKNIYNYKNSLFILNRSGFVMFDKKSKELLFKSKNLCKPSNTHLNVNDNLIEMEFYIRSGNKHLIFSFNNGDKWYNLNSSDYMDYNKFLYKNSDGYYIKMDRNGVILFDFTGIEIKKTGINEVSSIVYYNNFYYFANYQGRLGLFKSKNIDTNALKSGLDTFRINKLLVHNNKLYAATDYKLLISDENGENWNLINNLPCYKIIENFKTDRNILYVNNYYSKDDGITWDSLNKIIKISYYDVYNKIILAINEYNKIFISNDLGNNWKYIDFYQYQLPGYTYQDKPTVGINNEYLYVATRYDGIFRTKISDFITTEINETKTSETFISPNPASDYFEINMYNINRRVNPTVDNAESVSLEIYNIFGVIQELPSQDLSPALSEGEGAKIRIDVSNLSAGVYFIKIGDKFEKFVKL